MRKRILRLQKKRYSSGAYLTFGISLLMIISLLWYGGNRIDKADAAVQKAETVNVRIIGTTDLHGQLNSKDYELGVDYNNGGLARVMDLITKTRNELPLENTVTLDAGDVLYDYTTEYIFSEDQMAIQPIYQAMAKIGYDAITLGNHDFDYGYEYILRQLDGSGLRDITVVSNVTDSKTGAYPFKETMLITRQMQTNSGKTVEVTIGIIGQTIPTLTAKTHSYAGILKTEDMVQNARTKAAYLKEMGADIIIALSHTGIGPENPELNFKNVAYALSKIPEIDVVVCGHEHNLFPTTDMSSPYFKLPNVDKKTYLMNGKNVIMAGDRGKAIGVVDLSLMVTEDEVEIIDRKSELRMVTAQNTKENKELAGLYGKWEPELLEYSTDIIGELEKDAVIQNWFGMLGDNAAIQLLNDSKIQYAINFTSNAGTEYKNYPIVAASTYASFGANSINDYINIRDQITESDLSAIQPYNNYLYIYTITGKQLKEWLEWSASAYETLSEGKTWKDPVMSSLMKSKKLKSLLKEEWLNDWSNFFIFDGIDYEIDPTQEARYDFSGNRISTNRRVKSVKVNGVDVTDDMVFLLATNKITIPVEANKGVEKQVVLNGFNRSQTILSKYLEQLSQSGSLMPQVDYNWRVSLPSDYKFIVKVPAYADELFQASPYYNSFLTEVNQYRYYTASYKQDKEDKIKPVIIAAPAVTSATASPFEVALQVTDASGIKAVRMLPGDIKVDDSSWAAGRVITNNRLTVYENGTYTIYAEDTKGNKTVKKLVINNFDENLLSRPTVESYTNRKTKISGKAEPNTTIVFETYTGVYEDKIRGDGKFSYALPAQPSGTILNVYIKDEAKGLVSEKVQVLVKRTGPNQPSVYPLSNNMNYIHGNINDDDAIVIAITDDTVYVPEQGGRELYKKASEIYDPGLKVVEVSETVYSSGYYAIMVPPQEAGKTVTIYNVDHLSRVSRVTTVKVNEAAPNAPLVYEVSNIEKQINGMVPGSTGTAYTITLQLGNKTYTTKTDKKGNFSFDLNREQLYAGQLLTVKASDVVDGVPRDSFATPVIVNDIEKYLKLSSTNLTINKVTSSATILSGYYYDGGTVYMAISEGEGESFKNTLYTLTTNEINRYKLELDQKLEPGTKIYVMTRFSEGKILLANMTVVQSTKPELPSLIKEIRNTDKVAQVAADKDCEVTLTIGKKTYKTKTYQKDKATGLYIYSFEIDRDASGTAVTVKASNAAGSSDVLTSKVLKAAPDAPVVKPVKAGDTIITGSIELLDYTAAAEEPVTADTPEAAAPTAPTITPTPAEVQTGTETSNDQGKTGKTVQSIQNKPETDQKEAEKTEGAGNGTDAQSNAQPNADGSTAASTPETIKSIPEKVAATQTQVFAQIGKKTYEGTIDNKGNFTITIPKQKAGTAIKLWGTNKAGRGPLVTIKVVE